MPAKAAEIVPLLVRQAACRALRNGTEARFIDVLASFRLAPAVLPAGQIEAPDAARANGGPAPDETSNLLERDPIGVLASGGGYEDGESWWRDVIEENPDPGPVFAVITDAMTAHAVA